MVFSLKTVARTMVALLTTGALTILAAADDRTWTDTQGRRISGRLLAVENEIAKLRLANGRVSNVAIQKLSKHDQDYVTNWRRRRIEWPDEIDVSDDVKVTTIREDKSLRQFVYQTEHFEFWSDRKIAGSLIKDFALAFEATFAAIAALPLNLNPKPPDGHFKIRLFGDRFDYYAAGGQLGTAGVYIPLERHILVPMEGLNLKRVGSELRKNNSDYDNSTLIHEITHQVMHDWLKHLPTWMVEGMSEYMSALPYSNGKFRFSPSARKNGIRAALVRWEGGERRSSYPILPATKLFNVSSKEWNRTKGSDAVKNYSSSMLYVYYFMHLAGRGQGEDICAFTESIQQAKPKVAPFLERFETALRAYVEIVEKAEKRGTLAALSEDDIPEILKIPPDVIIFKKGGPHQQALARMIGDVSLKELSEDVIEAFQKEGIRLY